MVKIFFAFLVLLTSFSGGYAQEIFQASYYLPYHPRIMVYHVTGSNQLDSCGFKYSKVVNTFSENHLIESMNYRNYDSLWEPYTKSQYQYNQVGQLEVHTRWHDYYHSGIFKLSFHDHYEYDRAGKLIQYFKQRKSYWDSTLYIAETQKWYYNEDSLLFATHEFDRNDNDSVFYIYDKDRNLIEEQFFRRRVSNPWRYFQKNQYAYDSENRLIQSRRMNPDTNMAWDSIVWAYDANGLLVKKLEFYMSGYPADCQREYYYRADNSLQRMDYFEIVNSTWVKREYRLSDYDGSGNIESLSIYRKFRDGIWRLYSEYQWNYTEHGDLTRQKSKTWNKIASQCLPSSMSVFDYDGDLLTSFTQYGNDYSLPIGKSYFYWSKSLSAIFHEKSKMQVSLYPNPAQDEIHVDLPGYSGMLIRATITDLYGRIVAEKTLKGQSDQININGIKPGMYILILNQGHQSGSAMFIKKSP